MILVTRRSILIEKPVAEVFRFVTDLESYPQWFPGIRQMRSADDLEPGSVGKRYDEIASIPLRGDEQIQVEVAECIPERKLAIHASLAPVLPRIDCDFRDAGEGRTHFQWSFRARNTPPWVRALVLPILARVLEGRAARGLETLKQRLECGRASMRALEATDFGAADEVLVLNERAPLPSMGPDDVLVRVAASSVNPIDCARRRGYGAALFRRRGAGGFPLILGRDVSGVVESVGSGVRRFRPGDEVWGAVDAFRSGAWAEFVALPAADLAAKPSRLSHEEAASIPYVALTTWAALVGRAGLSAESLRGRSVLVHAGAGGVGSFAIQLLAAWGASVSTTCSGANVERVRELGAERAIDYAREDFAAVLCDQDLVFDTLGGEAEERSLSVLKRRAGAQYVSIVHPLVSLTDRYGVLAGGAAAAASLARRKLEQRVRNGRGYHWAIARPDGRALAEIGRLVEAGRIRPVIDRVYALEDMAKAHAHSESGHARGKIVIRVA